MKALILAAALVLTPATVMAAPLTDTSPITQQELEARASICIGLASGKIAGQTVVDKLALDTPRKVRDFALQCKMFMLGEEVGERVAADTASGRPTAATN